MKKYFLLFMLGLVFSQANASNIKPTALKNHPPIQQQSKNCPICFESTEENLVALNCDSTHCFHLSCLYRLGANPQAFLHRCPTCKVSFSGNDLKYCLFFYAANNQANHLTQALNCGTDINFLIKGCTALIIASYYGNKEAVLELLKYSAVDVNTAMEYGMTALMLACDKNHLEVVKQLLNHRHILINARNQGGFTALMDTSQKGFVEIVSELLKHSAIDVNAKIDEYGFTALMIASGCGHVKVVQELLKYPTINVHAVSKNKETALSLAREAGHHEIAALLEAKIAK